jgi:hypothetical protein
MFQMGLMDVMRAEREREIASAMRVRRLLQPQDGAVEAAPAPVQEANETRRLAVRAARSSGG